VATVPVTFRIDEETLARAREKGGQEAVAKAVRQAVAWVAAGKNPPALAEQVEFALSHIKKAYEALGGRESED
jgi:threonine dehydrogenase-like Zn-dependent dehydrogenase